jgi:hypothetical protein
MIAYKESDVLENLDEEEDEAGFPQPPKVCAYVKETATLPVDAINVDDDDDSDEKERVKRQTTGQ